jgi:hypothetical protein
MEVVMGLFMRPRRPVMRLAAASQVTQAAPASPPAAVPSPTPADTTAELERLAKLHESGGLTDTEFAAAKSRLLGV